MLAPNEGKGEIYIEGQGFRTDFKNAKLGCRIGNELGAAKIIDILSLARLTLALTQLPPVSLNCSAAHTQVPGVCSVSAVQFPGVRALAAFKTRPASVTSFNFTVTSPGAVTVAES